MRSCFRQRQDADRLNRLSVLRERRALRELEQKRIDVKSVEHSVSRNEKLLLDLDSQRQGLFRNCTLRPPVNIEWLQDSRKFDEALLEDRKVLLEVLVESKLELEELRQQLETSQRQWQKCRARTASLLEKNTQHMARLTAIVERSHD